MSTATCPSKPGNENRAARQPPRLSVAAAPAASAAPPTDLAAMLLARLTSGSLVRAAEPLARRTTLRVGGSAELYVEPAGEADLTQVLRFCQERTLPWWLLGRGSNLLIRDGGLRGVVICLAQPAFSAIVPEGTRLRCGAGARLKAVAAAARRQGLSGLEFLEGIPGTMGGAMRMNAGAMGAWTFEVVEEVQYMDRAGEVHTRPAADVPARYRHWPFFREHIALAAVLRAQPAASEQIQARMEAFSRRRRDTQPHEASAGCMFKNPAAIPAGKLIDELGLKGLRVGGASVSSVHANFIVNDGHATARDVLALIELIRERARSERGIELETEVEVVGEDTSTSGGSPAQTELGYGR